jgi:phenylacetate-CoA ligase
MSLVSELLNLRSQQWVSRQRIETIQLAKLQRQVRRAWDQTDFYREAFTLAGFEPDQLRSLEDIQRLPITKRHDLRAAGHGAFCRSVALESCVWAQTSGSTGTPMRLPLTRKDKAHRVLKELRALQANGYSPRDLMMILIDPDDVPRRQAIVQRFGILRREYISIFADIDEQIAKIRELRPDVIYSYASCLRVLAEQLRADSGELPRPKMLISAAELLDADTRTLLRDTFGVEPVDFYGSMEFGWIAWQCPERGAFHVNSDCLIVECLRDGKPVPPGEEGEMVVTSLHSDAAPLIRYATGDVGVLSDGWCACGRSLPLISTVSGRLADCIVLPGGRTFSPYFVTCALNHIPGMRQFQVIQEADGGIRVRLAVPKEDQVRPEIVSSAICQALGADVPVHVEPAESLPPEPNGKFRVVKSLVDPIGSRVGTQ